MKYDEWHSTLIVSEEKGDEGRFGGNQVHVQGERGTVEGKSKFLCNPFSIKYIKMENETRFKQLKIKLSAEEKAEIMKYIQEKDIEQGLELVATYGSEK